MYRQILALMDFSNVLTDTYTLILLIVLAVAFVFLMLYYGFVVMRVGLYKNKKIPKAADISDDDLPSVSVVLTAHNETNYLKENLVYLLEQDYPNFEVVVVDYTSSDDTQFVLRVCSENYPNLKPITFSKDVNMFSGKKYPLSIGIRSAKNDVILLTEPDCLPKSFNWIRNMMAGYTTGADIVVGYSGVKQEPGLLNNLIQYDNLTATASCLGMLIMGNPYTASGHNLSYRRDFFFDHGAFINHYKEPEGADDMFVNQNATKQNTVMVLEPDAFVMCEPRATYEMWKLQRKARYSTKKYYSCKDKTLLSLPYIAVTLFYAAVVLLLVAGTFPWEIVAAIVTIKLAWQIITFSRLSKRFDVKGVTFWSPLYELYFLLANTILYVTTLHHKKRKWK